MKNKLPILLALAFLMAAAMPLLRKLPLQNWIPQITAITVPPPSPDDWRENQLASGQSAAKAASPNAAPPPVEIRTVAAVDPNANTNVVRASTTITSPQLTRPVQPAAPPPQTILDKAIRTVESHHVISASIRQTGELFGHPILGKGDYQEVHQGPIPLIHLELRVEIDSQTTNLKQVCNGTTFWTYRKISQIETLSKLDALRAMAAVGQAKSMAPPNLASAVPGLGGLGRLMHGLIAQFQFTTVTADQLGGLPVWKVSGGWKPAELARLMPKQKEAIEAGKPADLSKLPTYVPDSLTIYLGQEDCFPFRVDYYRKQPKSLAHMEGNEVHTLLSVELYELNFNGPIDSGKFLFTPGTLEFSDRTDEFVHSLGL